jgi:hypothetical protein
VRFTSRKVPSPGEQRRNRRQHDRDRAPSLRQLFPQLDLIRLDLAFADATRSAPSPQAHTYHAAARAFFRFACPCYDCDGEFDLSANVRELAAATGPGLREARGALHCQGLRARDRASGAHCPIELQYGIGTTAAGSARMEPA